MTACDLLGHKKDRDTVSPSLSHSLALSPDFLPWNPATVLHGILNLDTDNSSESFSQALASPPGVRMSKPQMVLGEALFTPTDASGADTHS